MNQIPFCDWLPEWARWSYTASSGFLAGSRKIKDRLFGVLSHIINPFLTKLVSSHAWSITHIYLPWKPPVIVIVMKLAD